MSKLRVNAFSISADGFGAGPDQNREHPLGRAVVEEARRRGVAIPRAEDFRALPGRGVRATVGRDFVEVCSPDTYQGALPDELAPIVGAGATAALVVGLEKMTDPTPGRRR